MSDILEKLIPIFCGLPATGALARTATNVRNGGRAPLAGIIHSTIPDGILIYEISGPFFFASARRYSEVIEEIGLKILGSKEVFVTLSGVNPEVRKSTSNLIDTGLNDDFICDTFKGIL